ncbi:MAG TPA: PfkB family carbohydrate kinase [Candidatus Acidoferrales bacterium]
MNAVSAEPVDVVGVGLNATDTIIRLPHFPVPDSKVEVRSTEVSAGGQVASAMVACRRWGLSTRYVGKVGDDSAGKLQIDEMKREGVDARWIIARGCASQTSYILVDEASGERTVLWNRDSSIALRAEDLEREWICGASALLVDGHDTKAAAQAARWAREEQIPVVGDFDNRYPVVEALLEYTDFAITSKSFPESLTGDADLLKTLPQICRRFTCRMAGATLGKMGALLWDGGRFLLSPAFRVGAVDTTGAGDIFHGAFVFGLVRGWQPEEILEFSCAAAALNCTATGARGHIATFDEIESFRQSARRSEFAYTRETLQAAAIAAGKLAFDLKP